MLSRLERLLAELKRRHVLRMAGLYAVGAWVVVQVAATTFPFLGLPAWAVTVVIVLAALSLPITVVLAWVFDLTAEGIQRAESAGPSASAPARRGWRSHAFVTMLVVVALGTFAAMRLVRRAGAADVDANLIAVMPFRVVGGDASTEGLGEGMVDLFGMRLGGGHGVRTGDARSALSAWARAGGEKSKDPVAASIAAARALGAGRVITGSLVISGRRVTIGATLLRTDLPKAAPQTESVTGQLDSLLYLIDGLTLSLLARQAGIDQQRLGGLTSLTALQEYLAGKAAHRRGQYTEAIGHFETALEADSSFALAALALNISARRNPDMFDRQEPALAAAFRHRDRLSERDRALLRALAPRFPESYPFQESIAAFEEMLVRWPDDADAWFELGDQLLHFGRASDIENSIPKARQAFNRALAIDSTFFLPLQHLVFAALEEDDLNQVRSLAARIREIGDEAAPSAYLQWRIALALGDSATVRAVAARLDSTTNFSRNLIAGEAQWLGDRLEDAERAVAIARTRAATTPEIRDALTREHNLAMNRGMIRRAQAALKEIPVPPTLRDLVYLRDALFWDGDTTAAETAASRLRPLAEAPPDSSLPAWERARIQCELGWWDLARGRVGKALTSRGRLRTATTDQQAPFNTDDVAYCTALIDAWTATLQKHANARMLIQRADSINIYSTTSYWQFGNLITGPLKEHTGDVAGALISFRRTMLAAPDVNHRYVSTQLREIARLTLLQGDSTLARKYYRRYLRLRASADPALQPEVARVRAALASITAELSTR